MFYINVRRFIVQVRCEKFSIVVVRENEINNQLRDKVGYQTYEFSLIHVVKMSRNIKLVGNTVDANFCKRFFSQIFR